MELTPVEHNGVRLVQGVAESSLMSSPADVNRLIEACFSERSHRALLYSSNLPARFFDLSSGEAGAILQKLRNYRIRLAVVIDSAGAVFSTRFGEMVAEEKKGRDFGVFDTRDAALAWLVPAD
jgi:hypothetical protein